MNVKIKRIDKSLPLPKYQTKGAVGFDLYSREAVEIESGKYAVLPSNLIIEIPDGYMLALVSRSSTFKKKGLILPNAVGIVDQDFCGNEDEILIQVYNLSEQKVKIEKGERITQGIFIPVGIAEWDEVKLMENATRGGIGSTG